MQGNKVLFLAALVTLIVLFSPAQAQAMHIMEGFLPFWWCLVWYGVSLPFFLFGLFSIKRIIAVNPHHKMLLGLAGAFAFVLSALKIPSVTGSCSHPTGVGLGSILFGPSAMTVLGSLVLAFQALLLAHGGITTLGANVFSMAVVGPCCAYATYRILDKIGAPRGLGVFCAAALGDLLTYVTTSIQLALAFPSEHGGVAFSVVKFMSVFALTQIPLALSEGLLTLLVFNVLTVYNTDELRELAVIPDEGAKA